MTIGIYKIENTRNSEPYVGQSQNVEKRFRQHKWKLNNNRHENNHLQNAWNKYGSDSFEFKLIKECEIEYLDELEIFYIAFYDSLNNGYNLESGGNANKSDSLETRAKKSKNNVRYWLGKKGEQHNRYGEHHSEEQKRKLSAAKTSTGFFRVSKSSCKRCKQGFRWRYFYFDENKKNKSFSSTDLSVLMLKVISKGLHWEILDFDKAIKTLKENDLIIESFAT